jgi:Flp pilus assembly pilin Flp
MSGRDPRLADDERGVAVIEFALLTPVLLVMLMGIFDLSYNLYTQALLEGAIQQAARASTLEFASDNTSTIDAAVTKVVQDIAPGATLTFNRTSYASFSGIGKPEDYTDTNKNGRCDAGEPYEDINDNGMWDSTQGSSGQGGSRDVVVYQVTTTYPRPFPLWKFLGMSPNYTLTSKTVLANQPWSNLVVNPTVRNCT